MAAFYYRPWRCRLENLLVLPASWQVKLAASWQEITRQRVNAEWDQVIKKTLPEPGHRKLAGCSCLFVGRTNRTILIISRQINLGYVRCGAADRHLQLPILFTSVRPSKLAWSIDLVFGAMPVAVLGSRSLVDLC